MSLMPPGHRSRKTMEATSPSSVVDHQFGKQTDGVWNFVALSEQKVQPEDLRQPKDGRLPNEAWKGRTT